jgi:hypothetical protein
MQLSSHISPPPRVMDVSVSNLITQTCKDLSSIKFSFIKVLYFTKSELTCCCNNLARALVIGPIHISLGSS